MKLKFPAKPTTDVLEDEIDYCQKHIHVIEKEEISGLPKVENN